VTTRLRPSQTLLLGSLVFGLFFGAGNLVFPVLMGREAGAASPAAATGFLLTAVGLPILGVVASAMAGADSLQSLLRPVSGRLSLWFTCALYLTIGPLFAIPRTATVSYEVGIRPLVGEGHTPLFLFSVAFFALTALAARRPGRLMDWVGRYLTPVFLVLLSALVIASFVAPMTTTPAAPSGPYASAPLARGLVDGYSTMDALASLAFAVVLVDATRRLGVKGPRRLAVELGKAGLVGGLGMAVVYATLAHVGATSVGAVAVADNGGVVLAGVSLHYFGVAGQYLIAAIVLTACLKTAIGLTVACATTFVELTAGRRGAANATETSDQTGIGRHGRGRRVAHDGRGGPPDGVPVVGVGVRRGVVRHREPRPGGDRRDLGTGPHVPLPGRDRRHRPRAGLALGVATTRPRPRRHRLHRRGGLLRPARRTPGLARSDSRGHDPHRGGERCPAGLRRRIRVGRPRPGGDGRGPRPVGSGIEDAPGRGLVGAGGGTGLTLLRGVMRRCDRGHSSRDHRRRHRRNPPHALR